MDLTVDHKHLLSIYFRRSTGEQAAFSVWLCNGGRRAQCMLHY